ncbi:MAG: hypothetical protein ACYTAF_16225, partial [Planctomycetota bacterium]
MPTVDSLVTRVNPPDESSGSDTVTWSGFTLPAGGVFRVFLDDDPHLGEGQPSAIQPEDLGAMQQRTTTATNASFIGLVQDTTYFWQVVAYDNAWAVIGGSCIGRFVYTGPPTPPTAPGRPKPNTNFTESGAVVLDWNGSTGAAPFTYEVDGSIDDGTTWSFVGSSTIETLSLSGLGQNRWLFRVLTIDTNGYASPLSPVSLPVYSQIPVPMITTPRAIPLNTPHEVIVEGGNLS